jgi:uncharacterized membrane protein
VSELTHDESLEARVERLELLVQELHQALQAPAAADVPAGVQAALPPAPAPDPHPVPPGSGTGERRSGHGAVPAAHGWRTWIWDSELWLNKLGVGLVLFGVTFLFKYSIDQGWLTPLVRVGFGAVVGLLFLAAGLRLGERQRSLAQVLLGGGIAIFYIVGFAAFQLYELVGYSAAFGFMAGVTLLAFMLAVQEDHPVLSLIGVKGALGTPFLLYSGEGNFPWLVGYTCLVVASAVALFMFRGWRLVLWTAVVGGWSVLLIAYVNSVAPLPLEQTDNRWILQAAALFCWASFGILPAYWESRWGMPSSAVEDRTRAEPGPFAASPRVLELHLYLLTVTAPLMGLLLVKLIWTLEAATWGWLTVAVAVGYAVVGRVVRPRSATLSSAHLLAAALLLPLGTTAALAGGQLYLALAVQAALIHLLAGRLGMRSAATVAHLLFGALAMWFLVRLDTAGIALTRAGLIDLAVIALAFLAATQLTSFRAARVYRFAVHAALLAWFWRELSVLPGGAAYVSSAWSAYALLLLVLALRWRIELLHRTALATLLLVVAKLFVFDLAALEALWRILLFLGLGGVFLLLSYLLQGLWEKRPRIAGQ